MIAHWLRKTILKELVHNGGSVEMFQQERSLQKIKAQTKLRKHKNVPKGMWPLKDHGLRQNCGSVKMFRKELSL
jgi:hypothetical protein